MRNLTSLAIVGILVVLQSGCAAGVAVTRPRLPTIVIGEAPAPAPLPPPRPAPRHEPVPQPLTRGEAIAVGQSWCRSHGFSCRLEDAEFERRRDRWVVEFDAITHRHGHGKGHFKGRGHGHRKHYDHVEVKIDVDAWTGRILDVDVDD